ncbi:MAG: hypothetical protein HGJ94_13480 [Desulfosarcina sp.]|nr:hypothetical protein [Desulfosarcina sp.]MBC2741723.1 hypothetical protein [Desulfosarcina sp.]MBC2764637.1 hypothetical protein [Desulfosarcina sp.]
MGLVAIGMGPADQNALRQLEPEIIKTLRNASSRIRQGNAESLLWFGDNTQGWISRLNRDLNKMASILNTKPIEVVGTNWRQRSPNTTAAAKRPTGGWNQYTNMTNAQGRNFRIRLDIAWNSRPLYRPGNVPGVSKFHTIVHELTHLILNTDDVAPAYGVINCQNHANTNPHNAKRNADNWAFFVDDFR